MLTDELMGGTRLLTRGGVVVTVGLAELVMGGEEEEEEEEEGGNKGILLLNE